MSQGQQNQYQLRPYQVEGVEKLLALPCLYGSILADQPGVGKTPTAIELINRRKPQSAAIIVPASLRCKWTTELERWLTCSPNISLTSYEQINKLAARHDLVIFDEAHYLKNPAAKRTQAGLALASDYTLFMTGTPVVNRPIDMYPILARLGIKLTRQEYGVRFCAGHLKVVKWKRVKGRMVPARRAWDFSGASNADKLNSLLRGHCMVRRTKAEVLHDLPPKVREVIEIDAPTGESKSLREAVTRMFKSLTAANAAATDIRRIAFEELAAARLDTARHKLPYVISMVKDILEEEDKVVVFAHHREIIAALETALGAYTPVKLQGGMSDSAKDKSVREFQEGAARVFIGQMTAAGTGIDLTAASTLVMAEEVWVPGEVIQVEDRCHRSGQKDSVRIIHVVMRDSADAMMVRALVSKQETIERIVR